MTVQWPDRDALRRVWRRGAALWKPARWGGAIAHNFALKVLSVLAAVSLWMFVNAGAREMETALQVPVELRNIPAHLMIISPRVDFVDLLVAGPRTLLGRIDRSRVVFPLDLEGVRPGPAVFRVGAESFDLPRGVKISRINPSQITLELARIGRRNVPVRLRLKGEAPDGLVVGSTKVAPQSVEVVGPAADIAGVEAVETEPVAFLGEGPGPQQWEVPLVSPGDYFSLSALVVAVEIRLEEEMVAREFKLPVAVRGATAGYTVRPKEVRVTLRGPKRLLGALELPSGSVYIDAAELAPGVHRQAPAVDVPLGAELVGSVPETVRLELKKDRAKR